MKKLVVLSVLLVACGSEVGVGVGTDVGGIDTAPGDSRVFQDLAEEVGVDTSDPTPDIDQDVPGDLGPSEGGFLDPCDDNTDCLSGWCVEHMGEGVCSKLCQEDCPPGWSCRPVGTEPDVVYICVSEYANLCRPCHSADSCKDVGGQEDVCVRYGDEGFFCGGSCGLDGECPEGFSCLDTETIDGYPTQQCLHDAGVCPCTDKAIELSLWTPCQFSNEFGTCQGQRVCAEGGLTACDADTPAEDLCDGLDNDCDGETDAAPCDDENPCTDDACGGEAGCQFVPNDEACDDGDPCTIGDTCEGGLCVGGEPLVCQDDNPCTDDACTDGACAFTNNQADCDDGDPCTVGDECSEGACAGIPANCDCQVDEDCDKLEDEDLCNGTLVCDLTELPYQCVVAQETVITCPAPEGLDAPCLAAVCDPATGACGFEMANEGGPCEDGDPCTIGDVCEKGVCVGGTAPNCNDGNPCTDDSCEPGIGCAHSFNEAPCNDGNTCTTQDTCQDGQCAGGPALACVDDNPCTDDSCDPGTGCLFTPNSSPCDDGNACTHSEFCAGGDCQGGKAVTCDDSNICTDDSCDPAIGCLFIDNENPCNDGDLCTTNDTCADGLCVGGPALPCDDGNVCTDDSCEPATGCVFTINESPCDDGNACTVGDACVSGDCKAGGPKDCDDENPCTDDFCDQETGCYAVANADPCDDGTVCTQVDACIDGECIGSDPMVCEDDNPCTDNVCDPEDGCTYPPNSDPCDDLDACTTQDTCAGGDCLGGPALLCDDFNVCTDDSCEPASGCVFAVNNAPCDDGDACTDGDGCDLGGCVPGPPMDCDDLDPCTLDSCEPDLGCQYDDIFPCCGNDIVEEGEDCDDGNQDDGDGCSAVCGCEPDCDGKVCGPDGCGGLCETSYPNCEKQAGVCGGAKKTADHCLPGGTGWAPCTDQDYTAHSPDYQVTETSCDGKDNDCDNQTDEGFGYNCADLSCTGSGLVHTISDGCINDGGGSAGGDALQVFCCYGTARFCLTGEACPWRNGCVQTNDTCSRAGLGSDYMANAWCEYWKGHANYYCSPSKQAYF